MIDPTAITKFNRSDIELEEFLLFCIAVAGKTAKQISVALERFLNTPSYYYKHEWYPKEFGGLERFIATLPLCATPFGKIEWLAREGKLEETIKDAKLGQHKKLVHAFQEVAKANFDLRKVTTEELESIKGIGPKTSRYFILHSRKTENIACLDTHVLKYLEGLGHNIPKNPPTGKTYLKLEKAFIAHAKSLGVPTYELDLEIWNKFSKRSGNVYNSRQ